MQQTGGTWTPYTVTGGVLQPPRVGVLQPTWWENTFHLVEGCYLAQSPTLT